MTSIYDFEVQTAKGDTVSLSQFKDKVLLIVNTASKCGFTPQYKGLEKVYQDYQDKGLVVLGFPCNQFGKQEAGSNDEIQEFCELNYGVTFPVYAKVDVNGDNASPLFNYLKDTAPGMLGSKAIKWNFTKFLIGRNGEVIDRFGSMTKPEAIRSAIEQALAKETVS